LMNSLRARYRSGSRVEKCRILDELVAVTGYHRKHAIRLLSLDAYFDDSWSTHPIHPSH
jgi:hypothetical protein